jgi:hypothetical protein
MHIGEYLEPLRFLRVNVCLSKAFSRSEFLLLLNCNNHDKSLVRHKFKPSVAFWYEVLTDC